MKKKIILWIPQGRLGNLLFQYQAITNIYKSDIIFSIDSIFSKLFDYKKNLYLFKLPNKIFILLINFYSCLLFFLVRAKILSSCNPNLFLSKKIIFDESKTVLVRNGIFKNIIVFSGFFQNDLYQNNLPKIKKSLIMVGKSIINNITTKKNKIAVHVRFGDYENLSLFKKNGTVLPKNYYVECMNKIKKKFNSCEFIIFSDDIEKSKKMFGNKKDLIYFEPTSDHINFICFSLCDSAIISASSFSWFASRYISKKDKIIYAPRYWLGFKSKIWFPKYMNTGFVRYVTVKY